MRSVVYRFDDLRQLLEALDAARGQALSIPAGVAVRDGEWVLALFEFSASSRATAAAGKGAIVESGPALIFERRDWERLYQFASAPRESIRKIAAAVPVAAPDPSPVRASHSESGGETVRAEPRVPRARGGAPSSGRLRAAAAAEERSRSSARTPEGTTRPGGDLRRTQAWEPQVGRTEPPPSGPPAEDPTLRQPWSASGHGSRILLVDDDADLREVVGAMLESVGLRVESVGSAEEAQEVVRDTPPDLIVLDWNLPGMSGLDLLKLLRAQPSTRQLPVLFLTAHAATQDMVVAFAAGADDYVVKPFRAAELGARIFGLLRRTRGAAPS